MAFAFLGEPRLPRRLGDKLLFKWLRKLTICAEYVRKLLIAEAPRQPRFAERNNRHAALPNNAPKKPLVSVPASLRWCRGRPIFSLVHFARRRAWSWVTSMTLVNLDRVRNHHPDIPFKRLSKKTYPMRHYLLQQMVEEPWWPANSNPKSA